MNPVQLQVATTIESRIVHTAAESIRILRRRRLARSWSGHDF